MRPLITWCTRFRLDEEGSGLIDFSLYLGMLSLMLVGYGYGLQTTREWVQRLVAAVVDYIESIRL